MGNLTRRGFLGGVAGAGAVTLAPSPAVALTEAATSPRFFGRMFPGLPPFAENTARVQDALRALGAPGGPLDAKDPLHEGPIRLITNPELSPGNLDNPFNTAGRTFLGQFIDHDFTFDLHSRLAVPAVPEQSPNTRNPTLSLDSVYGGGPVQSPQLYDGSDRAKFRVESGGLFEDLPRRGDGVAIIGDPRNDENLIISGLHAAFLLFHNRVVDRLRAQNTPGERVFAEAQRAVVWHYQWIVVHEFLPQIIGFGLTQDILTHGRRFYRPAQGEHFMPVEFQGACYRFGHSQVRPSYRANLKGDSNNQPFFGFIFDRRRRGSRIRWTCAAGGGARRRFVGWQTFFDFGDGQVRPNKRIDTHISTPLFRLPLGAIADGAPPTALPQRNLLRHLTWSLPSGQAIAKAMGIPVLDSLPELREFGFDRSTPLWYYTLREAETLGDGITLAGASARLIGDVFAGLLQLDPESYLRQQPSWKPTLPSRNAGQFAMVDLLRFAGVDPVSRGQ